MRVPREKLIIDYALVAEVDKWKSGTHVHSLANTLTIYFGAPLAWQKTGDTIWVERFHGAERILREFIFHARQDDFHETL